MRDFLIYVVVVTVVSVCGFVAGLRLGQSDKEQEIVKMCQKHNVYISSNTIVKCEALVFEK